MMMPSMFVDKTFEELFDSLSKPLTAVGTIADRSAMRTDIKELDTAYEFSIALPGVKKEDVKAELKDGYLVVTATYGNEATEEEEEKYIRRERYVGTTQRSYFVGKEVLLQDIKASFTDGTLTLIVPKRETYEKKEELNLIQID